MPATVAWRRQAALRVTALAIVALILTAALAAGAVFAYVAIARAVQVRNNQQTSPAQARCIIRAADGWQSDTSRQLSLWIPPDFHNPACGCRGVGPDARQLDATWPSAATAVYAPVPRMRISYVIPHHGVTGGMKMIMQHIKLLRERGHWVQAVFRGAPGSAVQPAWGQTVVDAELLLTPERALLDCFDNSDILIVGWFAELWELIQPGAPNAASRGPVVYWEQGHGHVFGDPTTVGEWDRAYHAIMQLPIALLSVSDAVRQIVRTFGREAPVVPNAIDCSLFHPAVPVAAPEPEPAQFRVLVVGGPFQPSKQISIAFRALNLVFDAVPNLLVDWVCHEKSCVEEVRFPLNITIAPAQRDIPGLYRRGYHVFLFTSSYEGWGLPVLEAMATGLPVVTTQCMGVNEFCVHNHNCLMRSVGDVKGLATDVKRLLGDRKLARQLSSAALETAQCLTWDATMCTLERHLWHVLRWHKTKQQ